MRKIISLFQRDYDAHGLVRDELTDGAEWVINGDGVATRKYDGTCCLIRNGKLYRRHEKKRGRISPSSFEPAQEPDPITGDQPGWVPVTDGPEDKYHRAAFAMLANRIDGTYELLGPKVQGNREQQHRNVLIPHGNTILEGVPRNYPGLKRYFLEHSDIEGIVWHHPDGRMVKIKGKDFGLSWPVKSSGAKFSPIGGVG